MTKAQQDPDREGKRASLDLATAAEEVERINQEMRRTRPRAVLGLTVFMVPPVIHGVNAYAQSRTDPPLLPQVETTAGIVLSIAVMLIGLWLTLPYWRAVHEALQAISRGCRTIWRTSEKPPLLKHRMLR